MTNSFAKSASSVNLAADLRLPKRRTWLMHCALQEQSREPTWLNETAGRVRIVFLSPAVFELGQAPTLAPVDFATRFFEHSMKPRTGHWWYSLQECSFRLDRQSGQAVLQRVTRAAQRQCLEGCQRSANQPEELLPVDEEVRFGAQAKDTRKLTQCYPEVTGYLSCGTAG